MSTLQQIKDLMGRSVNYKVTDSSKVQYTVNRYDGSDIWMANGSFFPLSSSGWDLVPAIALTGVEVVNIQKSACLEIMNEFQGENRELVVSGTLTEAHVLEMVNDADFYDIERFVRLGIAGMVKATWDAKAINATWFTQSRKDYYSSKLQTIIDTWA